MKIAYIGASGEVGKRVVPELVTRGHDVTGISTHPEAIPVQDGVSAERGDIEDVDRMTSLLEGHDVVISSVQFKKYDHMKLLDAVRKSGVPRYFVCGGSGTLFAPGTKTRLMDLPTFPALALESAKNAAQFFELVQSSGLDWTYVSPPPPPGFAPGMRTGAYRIGGDELLVPQEGPPAISYEDYAIAVADEITDRKHSGRFSVGY